MIPIKIKQIILIKIITLIKNNFIFIKLVIEIIVTDMFQKMKLKF